MTNEIHLGTTIEILQLSEKRSYFLTREDKESDKK